MSWLKKARNWGQIPFADPTEGWDDPYSRQHPDNPRDRRKKDLFQGSLGFGSETHNPSEESGNGVNLNQIDSLTSGYKADTALGYDVPMEETPIGTTEPVDGSKDSGDSPSVLGNEDDESGSFILRYNPNDRKPQEEKIENFLRFQGRPPHRKVRFNNQDINVIE